MISAALFTLAVVGVALWEGMPLWRAGFRREAVIAWAFWTLGLVLGYLLILMSPAPYVAPFVNELFRPVGRFLTGE